MSKVNQRNVQNRRYSECMPPVNEFFAALAFRGMFRREFGRKLGVSDTMISLVAHGLKRSRRIETAIRDFTRSAWVEMSRRYGDENRTLQSEIESLQKELDASRDDMRSQFIRLTAIIEGLQGKK